MTNEELIELGRKSYIPNGWAAGEYQKIFNLKPEDRSAIFYSEKYGNRWSMFLNGWHEEHIKYMAERRKQLKVDDFIKELKELCNKYNVNVWYGGGDADCGFCIEEYQFGLGADDK